VKLFPDTIRKYSFAGFKLAIPDFDKGFSGAYFTPGDSQINPGDFPCMTHFRQFAAVFKGFWGISV
jgi:hypothetical protein